MASIADLENIANTPPRGRHARLIHLCILPSCIINPELMVGGIIYHWHSACFRCRHTRWRSGTRWNIQETVRSRGGQSTRSPDQVSVIIYLSTLCPVGIETQSLTLQNRS